MCDLKWNSNLSLSKCHRIYLIGTNLRRQLLGKISNIKHENAIERQFSFDSERKAVFSNGRVTYYLSISSTMQWNEWGWFINQSRLHRSFRKQNMAGGLISSLLNKLKTFQPNAVCNLIHLKEFQFLLLSNCHRE